MKKISTIIASSLLLSTALFANDKNVIDFEKHRISQNPQVKVQSVTVNTKKELPVKGWYGYILDVKADVAGKPVNAKDILFSDGRYIAMDLVDSKNKRSLKALVKPDITDKYHDKSKLIAGNHNAKDKIVVFSDPLCPYCMDFVPDIINHVKKNEKDIALYYYHFPLLRIHPASGPLSKLMEIAFHLGVKDVHIRTYEIDWDEYFDGKEKDEKKILDAFNKEFKTNITLKELQNKDIQDAMFADVEMGDEVMVQGTPTIYINKKEDRTKLKFRKLGKK